MKRFFSLSKTVNSPLTVGTKLHDFIVKEITPISDLNLTAFLLCHIPSDAPYLHIQANDANNVFSVGFPTPVWDSKGTPHILEHTTLCGSESFPIRDPFFKMLNRSLSTYMNAWTGSDFTMYPFSTQNPKDFSNLQNIYLDAVFRPLLDKYDFLQEGWRLEPTSDTVNSALEFKGIVFNEMKGVFSNREAQFYHYLTSNLLKGTTYAYESGGLPSEIVNLSYEELVEFHKQHYHLGNCKFFTYGNIPLEEHTQSLSQKMANFPICEKKSFDLIRGLQEITSPKRLTVTCPYDVLVGPSEQCTFSVSFLANDTADVQETFNLKIICHLLLDGPSSPMFKALIDSNIGHGYSPGTGFDSSSKLGMISIGLQGIDADDVSSIQEKIFATLELVKKDSFSKDRIDSVAHQLLLVNKYRSSKFGMSLASAILPSWLRDINPLENLFITKRIENFQNQIVVNPFYISEMIDRYFLQNKHQLHLLMIPDEAHSESIANEEKNLLQAKSKNIDKKDLLEQKEILLQKQSQKQDVSVLPCLSQSDINVQYDSVIWNNSSNNSPILYRNTHDCNGLSFLKSYFPMNTITTDKLPLLSILDTVVNEIGVRSIPIAEFTEKIKSTAGSISIGNQLITTKDSSLRLLSSVSSWCLDSKISATLDLASKMCLDVNFDDEKRFESILNSEFSDMKNSIADSGHNYAVSFASSKISKNALVSDLLSGLRQVFFLKNLNEKIEKKQTTFEEICKKLECLYSDLFFNSNNPQHFLITNDCNLNEKLFYFEEFIQKIVKHQDVTSELIESSVCNQNSIIELPFNTNYIGAAAMTVPLNHPDCSALKILAKILKSRYLHGEIREKGGAYGGGCSYSSSSGIFSFYSYRDPAPTQSVKTIENCLNWIKNYKITEQDLLEAKLSIFSELDSPIDFHQKGIMYKLRELSSEDIQNHRNNLLLVKIGDVYACAEKYLRLPKSYAIIGQPQCSKELASVTEGEWQTENFQT